MKQSGQKMVDDHTRLNEQVKPIASNLGVTPAPGISPQKPLETRLKGLFGDAFDKAYMQAMVQDHRKNLAEFKREAASAKDSQAKDAAQQGTGDRGTSADGRTDCAEVLA